MFTRVRVWVYVYTYVFVGVCVCVHECIIYTYKDISVLDKILVLPKSLIEHNSCIKLPNLDAFSV